MVCPNCGKKFERGNICPQCKVDSVLFMGTIRISNALYNKGLEKAKISYLSDALECLNKAITFNRSNIPARNLLGLIEYETGHVGEALKHWVISNSMQKENNPAKQYIDEAQKNGRFLERYNDAVHMYNQALDDLNQKSDDIAIIQLKKAIEINPKFVDALNLLAFCYLIQKSNDKAAAIASRVLSIDANNVIAIGYLNQVQPRHSTANAVVSGIKKQTDLRSSSYGEESHSSADSRPYKNISLNKKINTNFHIAEIISFVIGAICMFAALYVLVIPSIERERTVQAAEFESVIETMQKEHSDLLAEKEREADGLRNEISRHIENELDWERQADRFERTIQVMNAYDLLRGNEYQNAIDALAVIDLTDLPFDVIEKADTIKSTALPQLARTYMADGITAYNQRDYDKARVDLERAFSYVPEDDAPTRIEILYYLGWTYSQGINNEKALEYFNILLEQHPGSTRENATRNRMNQINR